MSVAKIQISTYWVKKFCLDGWNIMKMYIWFTNHNFTKSIQIRVQYSCQLCWDSANFTARYSVRNNHPKQKRQAQDVVVRLFELILQISCWNQSFSEGPGILRINTVRATLWYPNNGNEIGCNLEAGFHHKPNSVKNTCFKWISQGLL